MESFVIYFLIILNMGIILGLVLIAIMLGLSVIIITLYYLIRLVWIVYQFIRNRPAVNEYKKKL